MSVHDADPGLFEVDAPTSADLRGRLGWTPFSVLDRRQGEWQARKRRWLTLGLRSELGRKGGLAYPTGGSVREVAGRIRDMNPGEGTSIFDPVLAELALRWFSPLGGRVLDPFAGGSVRGVVSSALGRHYTGVDLLAEQVEANRAQAHIGDPDCPPRWIVGDATKLPAALGDERDFDMILTCPPYADLERYSDDPADLSTMSHAAFEISYAVAIRQAADRLRDDAFACWVISDVRDKTGAYLGLVGATVHALEEAGMRLWNDIIIVDPVGSAMLRAGRPFVGSRKVARVHQHMIVAVKGSAKRAAARIEASGAREVVTEAEVDGAVAAGLVPVDAVCAAPSVPEHVADYDPELFVYQPAEDESISYGQLGWGDFGYGTDDADS